MSHASLKEAEQLDRAVNEPIEQTDLIINVSQTLPHVMLMGWR